MITLGIEDAKDVLELIEADMQRYRKRLDGRRMNKGEVAMCKEHLFELMDLMRKIEQQMPVEFREAATT